MKRKSLFMLVIITLLSVSLMACSKGEDNHVASESSNNGETDDESSYDVNVEEADKNQTLADEENETSDDADNTSEEDRIVVPEYPMNLPEEFIIEYKGMSCNIVGKRSFEVMNELGIDEYDTYTWNEEGETTKPIDCWLGNGLIKTIGVDEIADSEGTVWINEVSVSYFSEENGTSLLGIKYGDDIDAVCQILGTPHLYAKDREYDMRDVDYITDYWWKDVEMYGDVYNIQVELWDDVLTEVRVYQE